MIDNETPEQEAERLAEQEQTRLRMERTGGFAPSGAQSETKTEHTISPITSAMMRGDKVKITVGKCSFVGTPMTRKKQREYTHLVFNEWPNLLYVAASIGKPANAGFDIEAIATYQNRWTKHKFDEDEAKRAQACADAASKLTPLSSDDERKAAVYVKKDDPYMITAADVLDWIRVCENDEFDDAEIAICDTIWLVVWETKGLAWPKTYTEETEGEGDDRKVTGVREDAPPSGCVWLDDYLSNNLRFSEYADLLRACNCVNGGYIGDLESTFLQIA